MNATCRRCLCRPLIEGLPQPSERQSILKNSGGEGWRRLTVKLIQDSLSKSTVAAWFGDLQQRMGGIWLHVRARRSLNIIWSWRQGHAQKLPANKRQGLTLTTRDTTSVSLYFVLQTGIGKRSWRFIVSTVDFGENWWLEPWARAPELAKIGSQYRTLARICCDECQR